MVVIYHLCAPLIHIFYNAQYLNNVRCTVIFAAGIEYEIIA